MDHTGNKSEDFRVLSCEHDVLQIKSKISNQYFSRGKVVTAFQEWITCCFSRYTSDMMLTQAVRRRHRRTCWGSWTHRPTVLSAPVSVDASPQLVWTHRPIGLTAPSKLDLQPHLGFAPLDLQPHPESATFSRHSSSQRNQIGPYHTNY